ncbi:non-structural maintenance of chromosomes element 3 homolog isoform X4 [Terrapene carolina triunguis]|uniref:non-structural maintenance of chromosomes element 3 homolog isoform X4 n=1 Tax=Terrapene triunguis TaxID=2587831 RepID=UPI000CEF611A|nr:non-structural maintenance of chromosomes element 3 homolog isoform X4 [Terrapene carolina triunguis]
MKTWHTTSERLPTPGLQHGMKPPAIQLTKTGNPTWGACSSPVGTPSLWVMHLVLHLQVFGLQLMEIDPKHHIYILVSILPRLEVDNLKQDDCTAKLGLLTVILSFLFMKGNAAKESAVWETLRRLRVDPGVRHEVFGDVKKLVTEEFVRQKYLEYNRIPHTDPPEFEFQWGARAAKETSKMQILRFVAKIQNKDPKAWSTQYTEAAAEEAAAGGLFQDISTPGDTGGASQGARRRTRIVIGQSS